MDIGMGEIEIKKTNPKFNELKKMRVMTKCTFFILLFMVFIGPLKSQKIYQVMYENECDVKIMMVADEAECDLKVCFVDDEEKSKNPGCWFVCDFPDKAQVKIFFTEDAEKADIKILIIESDADAGWVNEAKKDLM